MSKQKKMKLGTYIRRLEQLAKKHGEELDVLVQGERYLFDVVEVKFQTGSFDAIVIEPSPYVSCG